MKTYFKILTKHVRNGLNSSPNSNPDDIEIENTAPIKKERGDDWEKVDDYYRRTLVVSSIQSDIRGPLFEKLRQRLPREAGFYRSPIRKYSKQNLLSNIVERTSNLQSRRNRQRSQGLRSQYVTNHMEQQSINIFNDVRDCKFLKIGIYIEIRAGSLDQLDRQTNYTKIIAREEGVLLESVTRRFEDSFSTMSPFGRDELEYHTIITAKTAAHIFPHSQWSPLSNKRADAEGLFQIDPQIRDVPVKNYPKSQIRKEQKMVEAAERVLPRTE